MGVFRDCWRKEGSLQVAATYHYYFSLSMVEPHLCKATC